MMSIAEIIQDVRAITILGVTKFDYFAQLAPLKVGPPGYVGGIDAQGCCRNIVEHDDAARPAGGVSRTLTFNSRRCGRDARGPSKRWPGFPGRGVVCRSVAFNFRGAGDVSRAFEQVE